MSDFDPTVRAPAALDPLAGDAGGACCGKLLIRGITQGGRVFRPSDWAERLAGVMAQFRPGGARAVGQGGHWRYSPWCLPTVAGGVKCVLVDPALRDHEPMAWDFVTGFARDNELQVSGFSLVSGS
jgi:hypothetical protein